MKMLTYMSYGLPCISSNVAFRNTFFKKQKEILVYKDDNDFIKIIKKLKEDKNFSKKISKTSYSGFKKKYGKDKVFAAYNKII